MGSKNAPNDASGSRQEIEMSNTEITKAHSATMWAQIAARHGIDTAQHPYYDAFAALFEEPAVKAKFDAARAEYRDAIASTSAAASDARIAAYSAHSHACAVYNEAHAYKAFAAWAAKRADGDNSDFCLRDMNFGSQADVDAELARLLAAVVTAATR
jgi:hypothetical protein